MADRPSPPLPSRFGSLDALRGAALCGMVAYHADWDLAALGWPVAYPTASAAWTVFGHVVAATFLTLSGVTLVLARPKGPRAALRRLAILIAAGTGVTAATTWFAPEQPILFGILQCLAVSNAVVLPTLQWPAFVRLGSAALAILAPLLWRSAAFNTWPLAALGLGTQPPSTLDFRPLLPWIAAVLVGTVLGDVLLRRTAPNGDDRAWPSSLRWLGRNSLAFYLLHQPALYGGLLLVGMAFGGLTPVADPFMLQCRSDCDATGMAPRLCAAACACTAVRLAADSASKSSRGLALTPLHLDAVTKACRSAGG